MSVVCVVDETMMSEKNQKNGLLFDDTSLSPNGISQPRNNIFLNGLRGNFQNSFLYNISSNQEDLKYLNWASWTLVYMGLLTERESMHVDHYLFWKINSACQAPFCWVIYAKMQFFTGYLLELLFFWGRIEVIQFWGKNPKELQKNWFFFCCFLVKRTTLGRSYTWESWSMTMNLIDLIKIH